MGVFRVAVTDSGAGLSQEEQQNVFGEFTQFNKNSLQAGGNRTISISSSQYQPFNTMFLVRRLWVRALDLQTHRSHAQGKSDGELLGWGWNGSSLVLLY